MASAMSEYRKKKREFDQKLSDKREVQLAKINNVNLATLLLDKNKVRALWLKVRLANLQSVHGKIFLHAGACQHIFTWTDVLASLVEDLYFYTFCWYQSMNL